MHLPESQSMVFTIAGYAQDDIMLGLDAIWLYFHAEKWS